MKKVLVTGGSGFIALHCIAELLKQNEEWLSEKKDRITKFEKDTEELEKNILERKLKLNRMSDRYSMLETKLFNTPYELIDNQSITSDVDDEEI